MDRYVHSRWTLAKGVRTHSLVIQSVQERIANDSSLVEDTMPWWQAVGAMLAFIFVIGWINRDGPDGPDQWTGGSGW